MGISKRWGIAAFATYIGVIVAAAVAGARDLRLAAVAALVVGLGSIALAVRSRRFELADRPGLPSRRAMAVDLVEGLGLVWVAMAAYFVVAFFVRPSIPTVVPRVAVAVAAVVILGALMARTARSFWRRDGVERQIFLEAVCIAFFATLVVDGASSISHELLATEPLSPWTLWTFGLAAWWAAAGLRARQLR